MAGSTLRFVVEVAADQAQGALKALATTANQTGVQMRASMLGIGGASGQAKKEADGLFGSLRKWSAEQGQQARVAGRLAEGFVSIGEAAGVSAGPIRGAISLLIEGAAGGLGFGVAMEAAKLGVSAVVGAMKHAEEQAKLTATAVAKIADKAEDLRRQNFGVRPEQVDTGKLEAVEKILADIKRASDATPTISVGGDDLDAAQQAAALMDGEARDAALLVESRTRAREEAEKMVGVGKGGLEDWIRGQKILIEQEKIAANIRSQSVDATLAAQARLMGAYSETGKIEAEYKNAVAEAQAKLTASVYDELQFSAALANADKARSNALDEILRKQQAAAALGSRQDFASLEAPAFAEFGNAPALRPEDGPRFDEAKAARDAALFADQDFASLEAKAVKMDAMVEAEILSAQRLAAAWQNAGSTIAGAMDALGSAIGGAAGRMASFVGKMIQQAIQLAAALSATAGPFGWLNAAAAVAAMIAAVTSVPDFRAMGGPVGGGRPYIVGERGPEMFVPGQSGTVVPNHQLGGGNTYIIQAMDARSFEDALRRNDSSLIRVLRDLGRNGRV